MKYKCGCNEDTGKCCSIHETHCEAKLDKMAEQYERELEAHRLVEHVGSQTIKSLESKLADAEKENKRLIEFIELGSEFHE